MALLQSYAEEFEALAEHFRANFPGVPGSLPIAWENVRLVPDNPPTGYVHFAILNGAASQQTIGAPGSNVVRHVGIINVNVFVPVDQGKPPALRLADEIAAILRSVSVEGIIVREPAIRSLGADGPYFQVNISAGFQRDSLF